MIVCLPKLVVLCIMGINFLCSFGLDFASSEWHFANRNSTLLRRLGKRISALELLEYDYEIVHRKDSLHHVSDALSCAFENDTRDDENTNICLVAVVDAEIPDDTGDLWYCGRFREASKKSELFADWKVNRQLYYLRPWTTTWLRSSIAGS